MSQSTASIVRWREVLALLERVLETGNDERGALLRSIASEQPDLYPQLLTMLAADQSAESANFIGQAPRVESLDEQSASTDDTLVGQTIGAYRVLRHIGSGGMGQVWLAERADGRYAGQVAIKLLRSFGDPLIAKRFEREGQLLARLQHPNIARLLDAGALANGQLYLVLEYVDGDRFDRYFDEKKLTVAERIRAFLPVCDAVAHAHTQLVVHRDLKPSNILVAHDGTVKLLDFGIAKLLAERNDEHATELTQLAGRAFTPDFAAPEQIRGDAVSTQTDVYALGAIAYRLLAGVEPHSEKMSSAASLLQRANLANRIESPAMSGALVARMKSGTTQTAQDAANNRGVAVERLVTTLRGDLDTVIGKALKIDVAERYRSVNELRDDLQSYLDSKPVSVRPDALGYRAKKFVYRHKIGVAATAAITGAIVAGVASTLWQANLANERFEIAEQNAARARKFEVIARNEATRAVRGESAAKEEALRAEASQNEALAFAKVALANEAKAREQTTIATRFRMQAETEAQNAKAQTVVAQRETAKASSVKDFIVELFNTGNINVPDAEARELKVATTRLLNRGTERLKTQLVDQPEVRSELIDTVASLHLSIESPDQAEILYREQLAEIERAGKLDSADAASSWMKIGRSLRNQRKYKEAEEAQLKALAIMDRIGDKASETRGRALLELVQISFWTNTAVLNRATHMARATEAIALLSRTSNAFLLGEAFYGAGRLHEANGDNAEAAMAYEKGVAAMIASGQEKHAAVAGGRQMRARVLGFSGRFDEAHRELLAAQKMFEESVGEDHRYAVDLRAEIAEVAHQLGQSRRAIALWRRALDEQTKLRGAAHNSTLRTQRLLAEALFDTGRVEESAMLAQRALKASRESATPSRVYETRLLSLLGRAHVRLGDLATAQTVLTEAQTAWQQIKEDYGTAVTALDLALLHEARGEFAEAKRLAANAVSMLGKTQGKTRNDYWRARLAVARLDSAELRTARIESVLSDFRKEGHQATFPRAELAMLETLASAHSARFARLGQAAQLDEREACDALAGAALARARVDDGSEPLAAPLEDMRSKKCLNLAKK
jgi:serine/threonine protein kinase